MIAALILCGKMLLCREGLLAVLNSLVFMLVVLSMTLLISVLAPSPKATDMIANTIGLGMSFLCVFVPQKFWERRSLMWLISSPHTGLSEQTTCLPAFQMNYSAVQSISHILARIICSCNFFQLFFLLQKLKSDQAVTSEQMINSSTGRMIKSPVYTGLFYILIFYIEYLGVKITLTKTGINDII